MRNRIFEHFQGITPLASVNLSYTNSNLQDRYGKFYIETRGVMKSITIQYAGDIRLNPEYTIDSNIIIKFDNYKKQILIKNLKKDDLNTGRPIFMFFGRIIAIMDSSAYGFGCSPVLPNYDSRTSSFIKNLEATFSEDTDEFRGSPDSFDNPISLIDRRKIKNIANQKTRLSSSFTMPGEKIPEVKRRMGELPQIFSNQKNNLPDNYRKYEDKNMRCGNCYFFKKSLCYLWRNRANSSYTCNKWVHIKENKEEIENMVKNRRTFPLKDLEVSR